MRWRRVTMAAAAVLIGTMAMATTTSSVQATPTFDLQRLAGSDRFATAAVIALDTFEAAPNVLLASGENFPDALAGNFLAGQRGVPILLTRRDDVPASTTDAIEALGATSVTILGGPAAVGTAVETALANSGLDVDRIAGTDRYSTAAAIATEGGAPAGGTALLASGRNFPDALAAGPIAYRSGLPQLLTDPATLTPATAAAIEALDIDTVVVLGGAGAVAPAVEAALTDVNGVDVVRLAGPDRFATAAAIARYAVDELGHRNDHVDVATGANFPDALAGGPHAGVANGVVLLAEADPTNGAAEQYLRAAFDDVADGHVLGGSGVVSDAAVAVLEAAGRGEPTTPGPGGALTAVRVSGNDLVDAGGATIRLQGVNRMSTEYACIQGWGTASGPLTPASLDAMLEWHINAVRVPVNSDCWLGTKPGLEPTTTGEAYRSVIRNWVDAITAKGMAAIVDLHWSAPNGQLAEGQAPMADMDTSPAFWTQMADEFGADPLVVFDLFNEPYLERDPSVDDPWACWRDGCTVHRASPSQELLGGTYEAAGMQDLVDAVRGAGATNVLLLGGLSYTQLFDELVGHLPNDPLGQLAWSFHAYPGNPCGLDANGCRASQSALAAQLPMVVGEFGRDDCTAAGIDDYLDFVASVGGSPVGWTWIVDDDTPCGAGHYDLIESYDGTPSVTGAAVRSHYLGG